MSKNAIIGYSKKTNLSFPKAGFTHVATFTVLNVPKIPVSVQTRSQLETIEQGIDICMNSSFFMTNASLWAIPQSHHRDRTIPKHLACHRIGVQSTLESCIHYSLYKRNCFFLEVKHTEKLYTLDVKCTRFSLNVESLQQQVRRQYVPREIKHIKRWVNSGMLY